MITPSTIAADLCAFLQDTDPDTDDHDFASVTEIGPMVFVKPWTGPGYTIEVRRASR